MNSFNCMLLGTLMQMCCGGTSKQCMLCPCSQIHQLHLNTLDNVANLWDSSAILLCCDPAA